MNQSTCNTCKKLVPASTVERDGKVYLVKSCRACGTSETLISGDAARYQRKRSLDPGFDYHGCGLNCLACRHKKPNIVFVDITNRCNLNCPICINNTPSMGFLFEPPLEYFDKVFQHYSAMDPPPSIQLFGGEPTVRADLFDIIRKARSYGLATRVVTNGLKLADEAYCRGLLETKATILIAYDGANRDAYRILRNSEKALDLKQQALDNIQRIGKAKVTLMCLAAKGFNDEELPGLFQFCHDRRETIRAIYFMPLAHTWNRERFELEPDRITGEDIEQIIANAFPGDPVHFLPAMFLGEVPTLVKYLNVKPLPFAGAHPNCESMYMLASDGERYRPLGHFLKSPVEDFARALTKVEERLARRDLRVGLVQAKGGKPTFRQRLLKLRTILAVTRVMVRHGRLSRVLKGKGLGKAWHALALPFALAFGRKSQHALERHTNVQGVLQIIVLPFEDRYTLETERLERCPSGFAFWDPRDGEVKHVPVCAWGIHKTPVMRAIMDHYNRGGAPEPKPVDAVSAV